MMKKLIILLFILSAIGCSNQEKPEQEYCTKCGKVSGIDTQTGVEITGLNTSEFVSGHLIVLDSENFKPKLAKVSESYDINMVLAVVLYQHPDSGIIKIFTKK